MGAPDVAIIGGGICGASLAAFLAEAGASVVLYERGDIAAGASGRNSGVVQHPLDPVLVGLHLGTLAEYRALGAHEALGFRLPDRPAGILLAALDEAPVRALAASLAGTHSHLAPTFVAGASLRDLEPALSADVAACRVEVGFPVPPALATRAFAALAGERGARIETGVAARPAVAASRAGGVVLDGDGRVLPAGAVVVAAGPWSPALVDPTGGWCPIVPRWGVIVETELDAPPRHVIEEAEIELAIEPGAAGVVEGLVSFSLVTAAGRSAVGTTFLETEPDPRVWVEPILARAARFVPSIRTGTVRSVRACARPVSLDGRPLVGPVPGVEGAFILAGHGPWGISTGPGSARLLADQILGRASMVPAALDPRRFGSL